MNMLRWHKLPVVLQWEPAPQLSHVQAALPPTEQEVRRKSTAAATCSSRTNSVAAAVLAK